MAAVQRSTKWLFTREQIENSPSRRCGIEPDRELSYRQQAANLIQDMGQRLNVSQLTINTAIVYMHRFYMLNSFAKFHRNIISPTTLFLAAKVEEQPRKLEHVIKVAHACLNPQEPPLDTNSNVYLQQAQELVLLETIVLQTLGFEITIEHPHTDVVRCSQLVRASKDLAQTSYFMATNSLHLTTFCLQYKPTVVACVCIHLACKWSNWEIPISSDGKHWWEYLDATVTLQLLDQLTHEFLQILEKTPSRLKRIRNWRATQAAKRSKTESHSVDTSFQAPTLNQESLVVDKPDIMGGVYSEPSTSFQLDGGPLSLNGLSNFTSYSFTGQGSQQPDTYLNLQGVAMGKHSHCPAPVATNKLSLEKYREKQAAELLQRRRHAEESELHRKHTHLLPDSATSSSSAALLSSSSSVARAKNGQTGQERATKSSSLKRRQPSSSSASVENGSVSQEELKMKIKVSESGGNTSGGKSRHSPRTGREKYREHSSHRAPKHDASHSHSHVHAHTHSSHHKTHRSSKTHSASAPLAVSQSMGHGQLGKIERRQGDGQSAEGGASLCLNGQHMDYTDTFNMLDSLLNAHSMNY
ncbi:cyclin-T2-like [Hoplias malabaricus]|uniref:cyclin-T2-like n=1 Tax=Hoplias malabaricus TaxID=27720 RepID=UPI003461A95C